MARRFWAFFRETNCFRRVKKLKNNRNFVLRNLEFDRLGNFDNFIFSYLAYQKCNRRTKILSFFAKKPFKKLTTFLYICRRFPSRLLEHFFFELKTKKTTYFQWIIKMFFKKVHIFLVRKSNDLGGGRKRGFSYK